MSHSLNFSMCIKTIFSFQVLSFEILSAYFTILLKQFFISANFAAVSNHSEIRKADIFEIMSHR